MNNIDTIKISDKDKIVKRSGRNMIYQFDKFFPNANKNLNIFFIGKQAYYNEKTMSQFCQYINVFAKYYDDDDEYLAAMLDLKYQIDCVSITYGVNIFINDVIEYILSDSMIKKIWKLVEDNYSINLETNDDEIKEDALVLQFENKHGKELMAISMACKLTIPIICHYYATHGSDLIKDAKSKGQKEVTEREYYYNIFCSYFPLFQHDDDLHNKFIATANMRVMDAMKYNKPMWERSKNRNITPTIEATRIMIAAITDLLPKYEFSQNMISLNHVAMRSNITNQILVGKDKYEYFDISTGDEDSDELSGLEKLEVNASKISDLDIILSKINIKDCINKLKKKYNIEITKDEIKFYKDNIKNLYFSELVLQLFADDMGGYYDLQNINKIAYIKLLIIFKKVLTSIGFRYLQHLFTGNIPTKIKKRRISSKQLDKIVESSRYQRIIKQYSSAMKMDPYDNIILNNISILINTPIELVDYGMKDKLGTIINIDPDIVADEFLRFIEMI